MNRLHVAFVDPMGLEYNGNTLKEKGLGGSEAAVVSMAKELVKLDFNVTVFNNCPESGMFDGVTYRNIGFGPDNAQQYDVVISVRSPKIFYKSDDPKSAAFADFTQRAKLKVIWMHDTFTIDDNSLEPLVMNGLIDEIWTLSDFHTNYIANCDHGNRRNFEMLKNKIWQTRNGINLYDNKEPILRDANHFVFNSSFTKGMRVLLEKVWPLLSSRIQDARLTVIGGFYDFPDGKLDKQGEDVAFWRERYKNDKNVTFTGIVKPQVVSDILKSASFMLYPTEFPETFGISTLEALAYRTPVITSRFGALEETAIDLACYKLPYSVTPNVYNTKIDEDWQVKQFVDLAYFAWENSYLYMQKQNYCDIVRDICTWDTVALQWMQHIYQRTGRFLDVETYRHVRSITAKVNKVFGRRFHNPEDYVEPAYHPEKKINIVTTVRNGAKYIGDCIRSVAAQDYTNYIMYIADDGSEDGTVREIYDTLNDLGWMDKKSIQIYYINEKGSRDGAVANQLRIFEHIKSMREAREINTENEIVMILDGDDKLSNDPNIFRRINEMYYASQIRFTYGSCWSMADNIPLIAQDYPHEVMVNKTYRKHKFPWNIPYTHLRTFSSDLLYGMREHQFLAEDGTYMKAGGDAAMFYEMIERCEPEEIMAVKDILVDYNDLNPLNDYKVNSDEQTRNAQKALEQPVMPKKLLIAIPTARYIEPETFRSIYNQVTPGGVTMDFQYFYGYNVDQVRNLIADYAIRNNYDYLMCVDHDIAFDPTTVAQLVNHDKDIVAGIYRQRKEQQILEVFDKTYFPYQDTKHFGKDLFEVGAIGLGCALIKVDVFKKIGYPQFDYHRAVKAEDSLSEDVDFCMKARNKGYQVWIDPTIRCDHHGQSIYRIDK